MANAKPGPLVGRIKGSIGGTTFQDGSGDQFIRAKVKPVNGQTGFQRDCRTLMARASTSWSGLTQADRDAWGWMTGGARAGYVQYLRAWVTQIGANEVEAPPVPAHTTRPQVIRPVAVVDHDDLMLVRLNRELTRDEEAICRVYQQVPRTWSKVRHKTVRYEPVAWLEGLGATPNRVQSIPEPQGSYGIYDGLTTAGTSWTLEMWIRPDVDQVIDPACVWSQENNSSIFYWNAFGRIRLYVSGAYVDLGAALPGGRWYYVVLLAHGGDGTVDLWVNGAHYVGPKTIAPGAMSGVQTIGARWNGLQYRLHGRYGPVHISTGNRWSGYIEEHWNDGKGKAYFYDGLTETLLNMDEQTGDVLHDSSLVPTDWTRVNLETAYGPWCRKLYGDAERVMAAGRVNTETRVKDLTRLAGSSWLDRHDF